MNKITALLLVIGPLWLIGCVSIQKTASTTTATTPAAWEYKVVHFPHMILGDAWWPMNYTNSTYSNGMDASVQDFFNQLGKDGWILVKRDNLTFYFKRPMKS